MPHRTPRTLAALTTTAALGAALFTAVQAAAAPARYADDFNGDGYRDLATAAPYTPVAGKTDAGAVVVTYGSANGVSAARRTVLTQDTAGIPGTAEQDDRFGKSLASGDLNADGYADLVIGSVREDVGSDADGGSVTVVWGGKSGLSGGRGVSDPAVSAHDEYGMSLAVADFDGDGRPDLAVGSTGSDVWIHEGITKASGAASRHKLATGLQTGSSIYGAQSLAGGDVNGDGYGDLAVGTLHEDVGSAKIAGSVTVLRGSAAGLTATGAQSFAQNTADVPGTAESADRFRASVRLSDLNGDGKVDLSVGSDGENHRS
ncbi:FG-GAP and VCBS repeat-containing protein [Streptomyces lomondensis]|uniref:VCBS repeat-containing protein n=1 Tax=Streptomyces lomondensis TaxID=68229 RepID=A0ABQ2XFK3_9ACTN|nr:FG-GAP and VCBS repeat-containing protein [Streptomyces lomondensis]MCF0077654.1 VCBS repeat-containing protein [Streptomyces lomondensis]GGX13542.1 hypothetical protein GCM10010383_49490 [Streptomyces lomondensis]